MSPLLVLLLYRNYGKRLPPPFLHTYSPLSLSYKYLPMLCLKPPNAYYITSFASTTTIINTHRQRVTVATPIPILSGCGYYTVFDRGNYTL